MKPACIAQLMPGSPAAASAPAGEGALDGATQTLPALYAMDSENFNDITDGDNGFLAATGFDLVTGLGSPIADRIAQEILHVPDRNITNLIASAGILGRASSTSAAFTAPQATALLSVVSDAEESSLISSPENHHAVNPLTTPVTPSARSAEDFTIFASQSASRLTPAGNPGAALRIVAVGDDAPATKPITWSFQSAGGKRDTWDMLLKPAHLGLTVLPAA